MSQGTLESAKARGQGLLRVLVADDLGFMRIALRQIIETDGDMRVVGEARNGEEAVALARELKPDVVTMDIEMPVMDGVAATRQIVSEVTPKPVIIMVSSLTQAGAAATMRALHSGAADFVSKQTAVTANDLGHIDSELRGKIRLWADRRSRLLTDLSPGRTTSPSVADGLAKAGALGREVCFPTGPLDLVAIAVSTGGPSALASLLRALGRVAPPV
ncbi:MAG TPA: response regulator, partial [Stellaceae bacterium]|nr:response regulator [Stellaceae bacterium]